jgi:endonuclease/exonuclease/phosphatase family metal-dependent hydrolase
MILWKETEWKFVSSTFDRFRACSGTDCLATKGFLLVKLKSVADGTVISFIVTHLNANQTKSAKTYEIQVNQLKKIRTRISKIRSPCVIMGDFNIDVEHDPQFVVDELKKIGEFDVPTQPTTNTLSDDPLEKLDYVFTRKLVTSKTKVLRFRKGAELSDHNAVLKKISTGPARKLSF